MARCALVISRTVSRVGGRVLALLAAGAIGALLPDALVTPEGFTATPALLIGLVSGAALTGLVAVMIDSLVYRPLRDRARRWRSRWPVLGCRWRCARHWRSVSARGRDYSEELSIAWDLGFARIAPDRVLVCALSMLIFMLLALYLTHSRTGREMRAVGENRQVAEVVGIDVRRVLRMTWLIGGGLAGAAGVGIGLLVQIRPSMGAEVLLPMFAAAIVGGLGSLRGALLGGLLIGWGEAVAVAYVGAEWRAAVSFTLLVLVLLVRPTGLFGRRE
jgi:branched-chain amino acid transport system permease protein